MKTYRVICTKNPNGTIVDLATANNAEDSIITHASLLRLRQHETPESESLLPPLFLQETENETKIFFDKPEKASPDDWEKLKELRAYILTSYTKMKHQGKENTLELTDKNFSLAYEFIDPYKLNVTSPETEKFRENLIYANHQKQTADMKKELNKKPFIPSWQRYSGD